MLMGLLLWEPDEARNAAWAQWLARPGGKPYPYTLYYGVRLSIRMSGGLINPWRAWVFELAGQQFHDGNRAGSFPTRLISWSDRDGSVIRTAFATLTMEHALYLR
jgi:hypothetical protein